MKPPDRCRCRAVAAVFQAARPTDREKPGSAMGGQGRQLHPMQGTFLQPENAFSEGSPQNGSLGYENTVARAPLAQPPHIPFFPFRKNMSVWPAGNPSSGF